MDHDDYLQRPLIHTDTDRGRILIYLDNSEALRSEAVSPYEIDVWRTGQTKGTALISISFTDADRNKLGLVSLFQQGTRLQYGNLSTSLLNTLLHSWLPTLAQGGDLSAVLKLTADPVPQAQYIVQEKADILGGVNDLIDEWRKRVHSIKLAQESGTGIQTTGTAELIDSLAQELEDVVDPKDYEAIGRAFTKLYKGVHIGTDGLCSQKVADVRRALLGLS